MKLRTEHVRRSEGSSEHISLCFFPPSMEARVGTSLLVSPSYSRVVRVCVWNETYWGKGIGLIVRDWSSILLLIAYYTYHEHLVRVQLCIESVVLFSNFIKIKKKIWMNKIYTRPKEGTEEKKIDISCIFLFFFYNGGVRANLCAPRLIHQATCNTPQTTGAE